MAFLCVGGEHEGSPIDVDNSILTFVFKPDGITETIETYIKIASKGETPFFMLAGMKPVDAMRRRRELTSGKEGA